MFQREFATMLYTRRLLMLEVKLIFIFVSKDMNK